ncbi:MAG TPA: hypothetical protein VJC04_00955 [Candidatus Paceibacterota bacterium]
MFFNTPGKPSKLKKTIYLIATAILGIILSFVVHAIIEITYLSLASGQGQTVHFYGGCALLPIIQIGLLLFGVVGGIYLGNYWWRKVYIERCWVKK